MRTSVCMCACRCRCVTCFMRRTLLHKNHPGHREFAPSGMRKKRESDMAKGEEARAFLSLHLPFLSSSFLFSSSSPPLPSFLPSSSLRLTPSLLPSFLHLSSLETREKGAGREREREREREKDREKEREKALPRWDNSGRWRTARAMATAADNSPRLRIRTLPHCYSTTPLGTASG